jgi:hypothetical protein
METARTYKETPSPDTIWEILQRTTRIVEETARRQEETDKQIKETARRQEETDKQMKESNKRMEESSKRLDKHLGKLGNRFGEMVEYMIIPNLITKFEELGFTFTKANRTEIKDREHNLFTEVDALLENGDKVMAVEIKSKPNSDDIYEHIERMGKLRVYADMHQDRRAYLGAIAGVVFSESEKQYALKNGFYVIEPSGDTFNIIEPKGNYHPQEW